MSNNKLTQQQGLGDHIQEPNIQLGTSWCAAQLVRRDLRREFSLCIAYVQHDHDWLGRLMFAAINGVHQVAAPYLTLSQTLNN